MSLRVDVQTANQSDVNNNKLLKIILNNNKIKEKKIQLRICVFKTSVMFSHNNAVQNIAFILIIFNNNSVVCVFYLLLLLIIITMIHQQSIKR